MPCKSLSTTRCNNYKWVTAIQVLSTDTNLLNCTSTRTIWSLNSEQSTLLVKLLVELGNWNSWSLQNNKTFREKLQEILAFLALTNSIPRHITAENTTTKCIHSCWGMSVLFAWKIWTLPTDHIPVRTTLNINNICRLCKEFTKLLWILYFNWLSKII